RISTSSWTRSRWGRRSSFGASAAKGSPSARDWWIVPPIAWSIHQSFAMNPSEILARAKAYPFPRPDSSVILVGDRLFELIEDDHEDLSASRVRSGDSIAPLR